MGSSVPVSRVTNYRIRTDTGTIDATPTWAAAENAPGAVTAGTAFRIRIGVENTGSAAETITAPDTTRGISRCGYGEVAFSTLANTINGADAGASADAANIATQRLGNGTGSWAGATAGYDENESLSCSLTNGYFTEVEFGVILTGDATTLGVGGGETWTFQPGGLTNASANVPTFTTTETNGTAFQHGNQLGGAEQQVANSATISMTTAAAVRAKNLCVVVVTCDNNGTGDADYSEITGVTLAGAAMTKAKEFTNGSGAAQGGVTVSMWWLQPAAQVNAGSTITATFATAATNGDANTIQAREYVVGANLTVSVANTNAAATDGSAQPAAIDCTTDNIECLRVAAHSQEGGSTSANQPIYIRASNNKWSLWWTAGKLARNSGLTASATVVTSIVESTISTGTGASSRIGPCQYTDEWASIYVAFKAASVTPDLKPALWTDADTFYAPVIGRGARDLTPGRFADPDTFYAPLVKSIWPLTSTLFSDPETFYAPVIGRGARNLTSGLIADPDAIYVPVGDRIDAVFWDPSVLPADFVLSNDNLTVVDNAATGATVVSNTATTGKSFFRVHIDNLVSNAPGIGICDQVFDGTVVDSYLGMVGNGFSIGLWQQQNVGGGTGAVLLANTWVAETGIILVDGDYLDVAVDQPNGLIWFRGNGTGNWNGVVGADPVAGTGGIAYGYNGPVFAAATLAAGAGRPFP